MGHIQPDTHIPEEKIIRTYTALLSQSGTNNPTVLMEYSNYGQGITFAWTRTGVGFYLLTASTPIWGGADTTFTTGVDRNVIITGEQMTASTYRIRSIDPATNTGTDGLIFRTTVEIKLYR